MSDLRAGGARWARWVQWALTAVPAIVLVAGSWAHRWFAEDAFIFLRVVENVVAGHGPVFNAGERVEVTTSPLWLGLLVLARVLAAWALPLEWLGLVLGVGFAVAGLLLAQAGAARVWREVQPGAVMVPAGALVLAAIPVGWDYVVSGLEVGLAIGWVAAAWLVTVRVAQRAGHRPRWWEPVVVGLGPLVRPDLVIVTAVLGVALVVVCRRGARVRAVAAGLALPVAYQVFRMGYYGALIPNTGIAKEGGQAAWARGFEYLGDAASTYRVVIPLVVVVALVASMLPAVIRRLDGGERAVLVAPVVAGGLHLAWVARVGGDYMHGRLAIFGFATMLLPVAALPWPQVTVSAADTSERVVRMSRVGGIVLLGAYASWVAATVRYTEQPGWGVPGSGVWIQDTRAGWSGGGHPVTVEDYHEHMAVGWAEMMAGDDAAGLDQLVFGWGDNVALAEGEGVWFVNGTIGLLGYAAGTGVGIVDPVGLAGPVAARTEIGTGMEGIPGHEKELSRAWILALVVPPSAPGGDPAGTDPAVAAARRALSCGDLSDLVEATSGPLSVGRFVSNLVAAPRLTALRVPADPFEAESELCGPTDPRD